MVLLPLVLRTRVRTHAQDAHAWNALSGPLCYVSRAHVALHALLPLVSGQGKEALVRAALPRVLWALRLVGGFSLLAFLSLVL